MLATTKTLDTFLTWQNSLYVARLCFRTLSH